MARLRQPKILRILKTRAPQIRLQMVMRLTTLQAKLILKTRQIKTHQKVVVIQTTVVKKQIKQLMINQQKGETQK